VLDKYVVPRLRRPVRQLAARLQRRGITANQVSIAGYCLGLLSVLALSTGSFIIALILLAINRLADGIDGELARLNQPTDAGAFLDICLDFTFYALFPIGFALYDPQSNALATAVLVTSFVGSGVSFLAFDSFAKQRQLDHPEFGYKGFYYLNGLAEGTETVIFFALMCLAPNYFPVIAFVFASVCLLTAINRVWFGFKTLSKTEQ